MPLEGCVLVDVLMYCWPYSWSFSCDCINCTTMLLLLFSLGMKRMGRIESFSLIQGIPLSQDRVLGLGRCTWMCAPAYLLVRHPVLSWFGGHGVSLYLCPPGVTEASPRAVNYASSLLRGYYKQVPQTLQGHWSQPPFLSLSPVRQRDISGYIPT